jgi:hypothetical protein
MPPPIVKFWPWGEGTLFVGLDLDRGQVIAIFEAKGRTWGPADLMAIPEDWPAERYDYLISGWKDAFAANLGGDQFFVEKFGEEPAELAYGAYRNKVKAARKVIGKKEALKIAQDLIEAFHVEAPPWKTPFDNLSMVNRLSQMTFGKFGFKEILSLLEEADDLYWESRKR